MIATVRKEDLLYETGPQFPRFPAAAWRLVRDLNLESEFLRGDSKAKRYIVRHGTLHRAPFPPQGLLSTSLVSASSKWRVLTEAFRSSRPPSEEETLAAFVERKFGSEILDSLVDPIVSTVFMGDPYKMGMQSAFPFLVDWERNHGSLVRGALRARNSKSKKPVHAVGPTQRSTGNSDSLRVTDALPTLGTFHDGMARLPEKLAAELSQSIRYNAPISAIESFAKASIGESRSTWQIHLASGERIACEFLVLAVPAYGAAQMLTDAARQISAHLAAIDYSPISVFSFVYDRCAVTNPLDGFGFMVPRKEALHTVCTFWNSSLFPHRAPQGQVLITSFASPQSRPSGLPPGALTLMHTLAWIAGITSFSRQQARFITFSPRGATAGSIHRPAASSISAPIACTSSKLATSTAVPPSCLKPASCPRSLVGRIFSANSLVPSASSATTGWVSAGAISALCPAPPIAWSRSFTSYWNALVFARHTFSWIILSAVSPCRSLQRDFLKTSSAWCSSIPSFPPNGTHLRITAAVSSPSAQKFAAALRFSRTSA
jgi:oxygen-dependent protoporphyrinogen oxidase